jgi:hypothetical protein
MCSCPKHSISKHTLCKAWSSSATSFYRCLEDESTAPHARNNAVKRQWEESRPEMSNGEASICCDERSERAPIEATAAFTPAGTHFGREGHCGDLLFRAQALRRWLDDVSSSVKVPAGVWTRVDRWSGRTDWKGKRVCFRFVDF